MGPGNKFVSRPPSPVPGTQDLVPPQGPQRRLTGQVSHELHGRPFFRTIFKENICLPRGASSSAAEPCTPEFLSATPAAGGALCPAPGGLPEGMLALPAHPREGL